MIIIHIIIQLSRNLWHFSTSLLCHQYRDKCHSHAKYMPDVSHTCMMFGWYTLTAAPFRSGSSPSLFLCEDFLSSSWGDLRASFPEKKDISSHQNIDSFHITVHSPAYFSTCSVSFSRARTVVSVIHSYKRD